MAKTQHWQGYVVTIHDKPFVAFTARSDAEADERANKEFIMSPEQLRAIDRDPCGRYYDDVRCRRMTNAEVDKYQPPQHQALCFIKDEWGHIKLDENDVEELVADSRKIGIDIKPKDVENEMRFLRDMGLLPKKKKGRKRRLTALNLH